MRRKRAAYALLSVEKGRRRVKNGLAGKVKYFRNVEHLKRGALEDRVHLL